MQILFSYTFTAGASSETFFLYLLGLMSFIMGGFLYKLITVYFKYKNKIKYPIAIMFKENKKIKKIYFYMAIIGLILSLAVFAAVFSKSSSLLDLFFKLRYARVYGEGDTANPIGSDGGAGIFIIFGFCLFIYSIYTKNYFNSIVMLFIGLFYSVIMVERSSLFMWGVCGLIMSWVCNIFKVQALIISSVLLTIIFSLFSYLASKQGENMLITYFVGGIQSFDNNILGLSGRGNGCLIFPSVCRVFGIDKSIASNIIGVGSDEFNVFTFLYAPYFDFGIFGVFFIMLILGIIYNHFYNLARKFLGFYLCFYIIILYPLIMVFYSWIFPLNTFIYTFIFLYFLFRNVKKKLVYVS